MEDSQARRLKLIYWTIAAFGLIAAACLLMHETPSDVVVSSVSSDIPAPPAPPPRPEISDIKVIGVQETAVTITWTTTQPCDSQVIYGIDSVYEQGTPRGEALATSHAAKLDNLRSGTTYHFSAISANEQNEIVSSAVTTFRTKGIAGFKDLCASEHGRTLRDLSSRASGVSWIDFDGDDDLDLYVCSESYKGSRLFRNDEGKFADVTVDTGLNENARAAAWADFDRDGDADLLLSSGWKVFLFENLGGPAWKFENRSSWLPRQRFYNSEGAGWMDFDRDGLADVMITNGRYGIIALRNTGKADVRFEDVSEAFGFGARGLGIGNGDYVSLVDYDLDGWTDFLYNCRGGLLLRHTREPKFVAVAKSGIVYSPRDRVGTVWGDYDGDGDFDLFVPQRGANILFRNNGDGTFTDVTATSGDLVKHQITSCSAAWGDVDNDGDLDLYVGNSLARNNMYINDGTGKFRERADEYRVEGIEGITRGVVFGDYDADGDLDLFVNNERGPNNLFVNQFIIENNHTYLQVHFKGTTGVIGAVAWLYDEKGKLVGLRQIGVSEGWGCQRLPMAHFGAKPGSYRVDVRFATGKKISAKATVSLTARNVVEITP